MTPFHDEAGFDRELQRYIDWRTSRTAAAPDAAAMTVRVAAGVGLAGPRDRRSGLRLAMVAAALALLALLMVGTALIGGSLRDQLRSDAAPAVATSSPRVVYASPRASDVSQLELAPEPFVSDTYGYVTRYPAGWQAMPASELWSGDSPWRVRMADEFIHGNRGQRRLSIVSAPLRVATDEEAWLAEHVPVPPEQQSADGHTHCVFRSDGTRKVIEEMVSDWRRTTIDGQPAWNRRGCGHADGVVFLGDRVLLVAMYLDRTPVGALGLFDAVVATIDLDPRTEFTSEHYGYTIRIPLAWELQAEASETWTEVRPWHQGETDTFVRVNGSEGTFRIASHGVPDGMGQVAFLGAFVSEQTTAESSKPCGYNGGEILGPYIGGSSPKWESILGRDDPTWARGGCGRVDAVVFRDDVAYVMSLRRPDYGLQLLPVEEMLTAIDFDGRVPPASFTSDRYGYAVSLPAGWTAEPATTDWTDDNFWDTATADTFVETAHPFAPLGAVSRFHVAGRPIAAGTDLEAWAVDNVPPPRQWHGGVQSTECWNVGWYPGWTADSIAGVPGYVRYLCGEIDGVMVVGDRVYHLRLTPAVRTWLGDRALFDEWAKRIEFAP